MSKRYYLIPFIFLPLLLSGQDLDQKTLAVASGFGENSGSKINWTVGQMVSITFVGGSGQLVSGIYQPIEVVGALSNFQELNPNIEIFPNPTVNEINIRSMQEGSLAASLYDLKGQEVFNKRDLDAGQSSLDVSALANGVYFLNIQYMGKVYQFKISKK
ncbi:MAG: T9SS type A sorting domain-containing protein [Cyclobacteriaceae bacterium]